VIPTSGKIAIVSWLPFQEKPPSPEKITTWFKDNNATGLAIITGTVSNLVVLDFDSPSLYTTFTHQYPDLAETYTVQTRRGFHRYYHMPARLELTSRSVPGIDLQYNGRYVIAPPSVVAGHTYTVIQDEVPKTLSKNDVADITKFLDSQQKTGVESPLITTEGINRPNVEIRGLERHSAPKKKQSTHILPTDLASLYRNIAPQDGRNTTLFKMACLGRDNGLSEEQVIEALADLHAQTPPTGKQGQEPYPKRYREAIRTIASSFKREPRPAQHRYKEPEQLPNPVREELLGLKMTYAIRTIEALRLAGIQPGDEFTKKEAVTLLKGVVGQGSVYNALNAVLEDGKPLFERAANPLPRTPSPNGYAIARKPCPKAFSKCLENKLSKPLKSKPTHRPPAIFIMPSNLELAQTLGVRRSNISDPLEVTDLESAKTTRTKLHGEFIKRKPGQHTINFFATRLGLSERTVYRYNAEDENIRSEPIFHESIVYWHNLEALIPSNIDYFPHEGVFLVDGTCKKYPPKREIARKLLSRKQHVTLKQRLANYWWYGSPSRLGAISYQIALQEKFAAQQPNIRQQKERVYRVREDWLIACENDSPTIREAPTPENSTTTEPMPSTQVKDYPSQPINIRQPLEREEDERFAQYVYERIRAMSEGREGQINIYSARRMVTRYGETEIRRALEIAAKRRNVRKPVGFISTILRSNAVEKRMAL
jgi:hypothetical protein